MSYMIIQRENKKKKQTKQELEVEKEQNYWTFIKECQRRLMLKCPKCRFQSIYPDVIDHHRRYTHRPNHLNPNDGFNEQTEESKQDWLKKVKRW